MKVINVLNVFFSNRLLVNEINCNTSKTERNKVLSRFKNKNETINILCNVHILDEGIDIPECDSVFLTHPNHNPINFIQRISRCNRLKPADSGLENLAHVLIWAKDESKVQAIDKLISEYLKVIPTTVNNIYIKTGNLQIIINNPIVSTVKNKSISYDTLIDYIKNESNVPQEFIDDFFSLYQYNTKDTEFVIDLDVLVKWLDTRKSTIKETLVKSYTKNVDYTEKNNKLDSAGRPSAIIMLTPDCMKRLCMVSRTKKAEDVRSYFIELEKHINQYKDVIIERYVTNHTAQPTDITGGVIYLLNTDLNLPGVYKIGKTADFKSRLKTHQSAHVDNIKVIKVYRTTDIDNVEKCLKQYLKSKQFKKYKEFYQVDIDDISKLFTICNNATLSAKKVLSKADQKGGYYIYLERE